MLKIAVVFAICIASILIITVGSLIAFFPPGKTSPLDHVEQAGRKLLEASERVPSATFKAKDNTEIFYRIYSAPSPASERVAILIHGSSGAGYLMHAVAEELKRIGITSYVPDLRGHFMSSSPQTRGDVEYIGQYDDDLRELVKIVRAKHPAAKPILVGVSAGGGLTVRLASGDFKGEFSGFVLVAPYLGAFAPSAREQGLDSNFVSAAPRRIMGLHFANVVTTAFNHLAVIHFGASPESAKVRATKYSYRLWKSFEPKDWKADLGKIVAPTHLIVGSADELFKAAGFTDAIAQGNPTIKLNLLQGVGHFEIVTRSEALKAISEAAENILSNVSR